MRFTDENGKVWESVEEGGTLTVIRPIEPEEEKPWPQEGDEYWIWGYSEDRPVKGTWIGAEALHRVLEIGKVYKNKEECEAAHRVDVARATLKRIAEKYPKPEDTSKWWCFDMRRLTQTWEWENCYDWFWPEVTYFGSKPTDTDKAEIEQCLRVIETGGVE